MPEKIIYEFGVYSLDPEQHSLRSVDGEIVREVKGRIFDLLEVFVRSPNPEHLLRKDYLIEAVFGRDPVDDRTLDRYVRKLRGILETNDKTGRQYTKTVRGLGYKFVIPVIKRTVRKITTREGPDSIEAHENYIWGRYLLNTFTTEKGLMSAIDCFQKTYKSENLNYTAAALAGEAEAYIWLSVFSWRPPKEMLTIAESCSKKALSIHEASSEAHTAQAYVFLFDREWAKAEEEFKQAIKLNQKSEETFTNCYQGYSLLLAAKGKWEAALANVDRALTIDREMERVSFINNVVKAIILFESRDFQGCQDYLRRILAREPDIDAAYYILGSVEGQVGEFGDAVTETDKGFEYSESNVLHTLVRAQIVARLGQKEQALGLLKKLSKERYISPFHIALVYTHFNVEEAYGWLERAFDEYDPWLLLLKVDPRVDKLRVDPRTSTLPEHPRYAALLQRLGLA
jgi:DNA-binding winged helix-turn-helix (wHTH) protein/Tfp pilus assembly protein PilF